MIQFCYHWSPIKFWLTSTDLGSRGFLAKSARWKSFLRKLYLKNMSPEVFCYDVSRLTSSNFLYARCATPSQSVQKDVWKNDIREFCPPNFFILVFFHQNEEFVNLRTQKFKLNKIRGKSVAGEKDRKCDKWISD